MLSGQNFTCSPLKEPENGTIACTRSGFVVGDVCTIRCDDGFDLVGSDTRTCLGNQIWSGEEATCVPGGPYCKIIHCRDFKTQFPLCTQS